MSIYFGGAALVDCIAVFTAATTDETNASERPSDPIPDVDASTAAWEGGFRPGQEQIDVDGIICRSCCSSRFPSWRHAD